MRSTREELLNYFNQGYKLATVTSRQLYFRMNMSPDGQQAKARHNILYLGAH